MSGTHSSCVGQILLNQWVLGNEMYLAQEPLIFKVEYSTN